MYIIFICVWRNVCATLCRWCPTRIIGRSRTTNQWLVSMGRGRRYHAFIRIHSSFSYQVEKLLKYMYSINFRVCMYVCNVILRWMCVCSYDVSIDYRLSINKLARKNRASMDKPAIHLKYINSMVTSFFDVLGKANHRPYFADEVILTRSDDLLQPTIGWSSNAKKDAAQQKLSDGTINTPSKSVPCWRSQNWHYD